MREVERLLPGTKPLRLGVGGPIEPAQQPSRHRKIVVRSKRDGRGKLRVCGTGCTRQQRSAPPREYLLVFKDIDMKRAEESSALIGERTSSTPLNFALGTAQRRPNCRPSRGARRWRW